MDTVVVGVDGSEASGVALEFAVEEAARRNAALRVVSTWEFPAIAQPEMVMEPEVVDSLRGQADAVVADAVARARELQPNLPCEGVVLAGRPGDLLVQEGLGAVLIVVGRRGHGGLTGFLLGSVSRHVADHAPCPVTVVPPLTGV